MRMIRFPFSICRYMLKKLHAFYYKIRLKRFGSDSVLYAPLSLDGKKNISIGQSVVVGYKTWLAAVPLTGADNCSLIIEDECCIGHFNHIFCTERIVLEKGVLTADRVYISDNLHGYENIHAYIKNQPIVQNGQVTIGEGSWLGENVCVLGANIGKHCVIGANSVVTKDIPDYCVAVGAPARIIKRYNFIKHEWCKG